MTMFRDGVFQFGGVPVGSGMLPLMGGSGKVFFVDPANGSDGNVGRRPDQALDTVAAAYDLCTDGAGDTIYLLNDGNTSGSAREAATITWAKDNTHLVGLCAPVVLSQRARITPATTDTAGNTPMITVSGHGNVFANVAIQNWITDDAVAGIGVDVTGNRNYFYNCHIVGISHANVGDEATAADLRITGGEENLFEKCTIGIDTVPRSTTNASVELATAAARNMFVDCLFPMLADNAGALFVKVDGSGDIDRFVMFKNCTFHNAVESTGTSLTSAVSAHNSAGGTVVLQSCIIVGADDVAAADNGNVYTTPIPAAGTGALGTVVTQ